MVSVDLVAGIEECSCQCDDGVKEGRFTLYSRKSSHHFKGRTRIPLLISTGRVVRPASSPLNIAMNIAIVCHPPGLEMIQL